VSEYWLTLLSLIVLGYPIPQAVEIVTALERFMAERENDLATIGNRGLRNV